MSISPLSGIGSASYASGSDQPRRDFGDLGRALKSGDLSGAQQAFAALTQDLSQQSSTSSNPNAISSQLGDPNSVLGKDLAAVGQAIQSGDLSGAQQDFTKLRQDVRAQVQSQDQTQGKTTHGHHHHGHRVDTDSNTTSNGDSSSTTTTSSEPASSTDLLPGSTVNVTA